MARQGFRLVRLLVILVLVPPAIFMSWVLTGPILSGAIFLRWPPPRMQPHKDVPRASEPLHKGHFEIATGLYVREDDDLTLEDSPRFVLRRTYRTGDRISREFGIGSTHSGEWYLIGDPVRFSWAELIFPDASRVHFDRISAGRSYFNALYEHWGDLDAYAGSRLGWTWRAWTLRLYDGSIATFLPCGPRGTKCAMTEWREPDGDRTRFKRTRTGRLLEINTGVHSIVFAYDDGGRVVEAHDDRGGAVRYAYDRQGRLVRARYSSGIERLYAYDSMDRMTRIEEPGRIVSNTYDGDGLVVRQVTRFTDTSGRAPWVVEAAYKRDGGIVRQVDVREGDGSAVRTLFDPDRYITAQVWGANGPGPVRIAYERNSVTHAVQAVTVTCRSGRWRSTHSSVVQSGDEQSIARDLVAKWCGDAS